MYVQTRHYAMSGDAEGWRGENRVVKERNKEWKHRRATQGDLS